MVETVSKFTMSDMSHSPGTVGCFAGRYLATRENCRFRRSMPASEGPPGSNFVASASARGQPHHGDLAIRLGLVTREVRSLARDALPRRCALFAGQRLRRHRGLATLELHLDLVGVRGEVVEPGRMARRAALRSDDEPAAVTLRERHDHGRPALPALGADGVQVQQWPPAHLAAREPMD